MEVLHRVFDDATLPHKAATPIMGFPKPGLNKSLLSSKAYVNPNRDINCA